jgi:hypothetical protein
MGKAMFAILIERVFIFYCYPLLLRGKNEFMHQSVRQCFFLIYSLLSLLDTWWGANIISAVAL